MDGPTIIIEKFRFKKCAMYIDEEYLNSTSFCLSDLSGSSHLDGNPSSTNLLTPSLKKKKLVGFQQLFGTNHIDM